MTLMEYPATAEQSILTLDNAMMLAVQWQSEGQLSRAETILNRILQVNPTHAHALHCQGVIAHQTGKIHLAIQFIQRALASDPMVALFHSNLGEMHRQVQAIDLSIAHGQRAVELDAQSATAVSNLGIAYYDAKQYDLAETCHKRALALNPQQSNSLNNMGSLYKERKNTAEAIRFYQAAIASSPNFADPLNNLGAILVIEQQFNQALELLSRAITLSPAFADAHCNIGFAFHGLDNFDAALIHFQRALQLKPHYAEAYIGLSKVHCARFELELAENHARKAIEIDPGTAEFYQCLAEIYIERGESTQALAYFDHAITLDPSSGIARISKGNLLVELGESDAAEALFTQAQHDQSTNTQLSAHYSLVHLRTVKPSDQSIQALLSMATNMENMAPKQHDYLHFSLGKCYDDTGEWTLAFEHFKQGCQLKRSRIIYNTNEQAQFAQRIIACFTEKTIASLRESANLSALPVFVLGMPRSGTTLIEQIIASHPSVYGAGELSHLSTLTHRPIESAAGPQSYPENIHYLTPTACRAIADEYLSCLQRYAPTATRITDKMPANFITIGLIHALLPNAKIIHVERNPIDTCLSCYTKLFRNGQLFSYDLTELGHFYAIYRRLMAHWRHILPANSWLDIRYEDVVTDLESEARRLIAYCDLEWDPACLSFHSMKRQVRTASLTQVRQPIYTSSIERWRRFEHELAPLIQVLSDNACL